MLMEAKGLPELRMADKPEITWLISFRSRYIPCSGTRTIGRQKGSNIF